MSFKMLFIFYVDTGINMTFDAKFALQSVSELQEAIERECGVMAAHQVLLMSGGESLEPNARVCSYSAGTDTNPIYLFSKSAIESHLPPTPNIDYGSDVDLQNQVDSSLAMPATLHTLVARAQLAQQCCGLAREQTRICERLVHDQHLQQQGWAAVVANLEDITQMFQSRVDLLQQNFSLFLSEREQHLELLKNFHADLGTLAKIPILPALRAYAEGLLSSNNQATDEKSANDEDEVLNLLKWISAKDNQSSLQQLAEQCSKGLEQFNEKVMETLKTEVNAAIDSANKQDMKEIKGLGDRLFALEQLMAQTKKLVQEQSELAQGFLQNQNRASNLGDASVLPDLCTSHRRQLQLMLQNHNQLRDIRRRCTKAKEELSMNIHHRLKWIMYVENKMMEVDSKLVLYHESLKRLKRYLEVLQQIHLAPEMYVNAITEVVRRRSFSQAFLVWASNLACQLLTVHNEELNRRREFQSKFDGHFLNSLFPGLEDIPPAFATQAPSVFDNGLPKLTVDDIESLKTQLPDLALIISTPDLNGIRQFFMSRSLTEGSAEENKNKDDVPLDDGDPAKKEEEEEEECARVPVLGDRGEFESETDTEEFEKIGQGAADMKLNSFDSAKQTAQTQLEENLGNTRGEVERLQNILRTIKSVATEALVAFREELATLRGQTIVDKNGLDNTIERIQQVFMMHAKECERSIKEREQELIVDHELEMADVKKLTQDKEEEIRTLKETIREKETVLSEHERLVSTMHQKMESMQKEMRNLHSLVHYLEESLNAARTTDKENAVKEARDEGLAEIATLTNSLTQYRERIRELEESLDATRADQQRLVKEATDKLQMDYKTELETIRSRFKLMAASTMERSPSDSSLEKIELQRLDVIELANHEAILAQVKEDAKKERAAAIRAAVEKERADCAAKLEHELRLTKERNEFERQILFDKAMRTAWAETDGQMEIYRNREIALVEECERYKNTIKNLTESENIVRQTLNEKVENLKRDMSRLENTVITEKTLLEQRERQIHRVEMERNELERELNEERTKTNQNEMNMEILKALEAERDELMVKLEIYAKSDDVDVSESKKVRLEAIDDLASLSSKIEVLESENKRLTGELQSISEDKEATEAKVETLKADNVRLETRLVNERSKRGSFNVDPGASSSSGSTDGRDKDMCASVAVVPDSLTSRDATTSPDPSRHDSDSHVCEKLTRSTANLIQQGSVSTSTCNQGDTVLVLWDIPHRNYMLLQESSTLYFLNSDCKDELDLRLNADGTPRRIYAIAEVVDKEYCHAKKAENRYRVPQGTKFYRVRVKSVQKEVEMNTSVKNQQ